MEGAEGVGKHAVGYKSSVRQELCSVLFTAVHLHSRVWRAGVQTFWGLKSRAVSSDGSIQFFIS